MAVYISVVTEINFLHLKKKQNKKPTTPNLKTSPKLTKQPTELWTEIKSMGVLFLQYKLIGYMFFPLLQK